MEVLLISIGLFLFYAYKVYAISYYYDYRYVGNVIRFFTIYAFISMIFRWVIFYLNYDKNYSDAAYLCMMLLFCVVSFYYFKKYLIDKFGTEERFANSEEIDNIGSLKE